MSLPFQHVRHQGRVLASLGEAAVSALWKSVAGGDDSLPETPGPEIRRTVAAPAPDLIHDFIRASGGDPASWRGVVPPHLFPQWGFALAAKAASALPYPLWRVLNAGSRMVVNAPLPAGVPLEVRARLVGLEENERRVVVRTRLATGTAEIPDCLAADLYAFVPLGGGGKEKKDPEAVPAGALEIDRWKLPATAGLEFALLTGDFNPIHWVPPYARAFGLRSVILHGFGTMARAAEALVRARFAGDGAKLRVLDVRFTRPLVLPADVGLFADGERLFVGKAPGAPAVLVGSYSSTSALDGSNSQSRCR